MFLSMSHCPHVFNPTVNLYSGKLSMGVRLCLLQCITNLIDDHAKCLLSLKSDSLGLHLTLLTNTLCLSNLSYTCSTNIFTKTKKDIIGQLIYDKHVSLYGDMFSILSYTIKLEHSARDCIRILYKHMKKSYDYVIHGSNEEKASGKLIIVYLGPFIASLLVSDSKGRTPQIVHSFIDCLLTLMEKVFCVDIASSKLKLATLYYLKGDIKKTIYLLNTIEKKFDKCVVTLCGNCDCMEHPSKEFVKAVSNCSDDITAHTCVSTCVTFLRQERRCCPFQFRYEMFRSTTEDARQKKIGMHEWMDWAEIDAQPYLYFLQFLVYKRMKNEDLVYEAIFKLASLLQSNAALYHTETAFNLLGQCWERQGNPNLALMCYDASLRLVDVNNAAKWHLAKLVYRILCESGKIKKVIESSSKEKSDGLCCKLL